ncbi:dipeptide/oligopeptide/nickel ABC transporter permease/ATP-binding protein [Demequina sp. NBRC 110051]|uniref:dipeptide/oligopeptide/nickel ABC transporter permease/ATP-binding protein n=1 Tax=Demequina sp. NBRC 110051 TaxID=1570340 RepID=UPI0013563414|nr:dipeptide/oligopeptide/nickel ABC transporter permease/ATP-binding protein [Demequina sp. NBRC 110051]
MSTQVSAVTVGDPAASSPSGKQASSAVQAVKRLATQPSTLIAIVIIAIVVICAVFAPLIAPYPPDQTDTSASMSGPTAAHWLGADTLGRDLFSQLIYGARTALIVAVGSVALAMLIGIPMGLILGYKGGWYDRLGSRIMDMADALPGLMVGFVVIAILGRGIGILIFAIGLIFCMNFARIARAITLGERKKLYVDSATVVGHSNTQIIFRQVLPNLAGPMAVQGAVFLGSAIKLEAALSFLGLGLSDDQPSWGGMLRFAAENQADHGWMVIAPGLAIVLTVLAFNLLGDGINDALSGRRHSRMKRSLIGKKVVVQAADAPAGARTDVASRTATVPTDTARTAPASPAAAPAVVTETAEPATASAVLNLCDLTVVADRPDGGTTTLVNAANLHVNKGEILGILGESGSGKSMIAKSALGLLPAGVRLESGQVLLNGKDLAAGSQKDHHAVLGGQLGVVFQNPQANLSPVHTVGRQMTQVLQAHHSMSRAAAKARAAELLDLVGVDEAPRRLTQYPYQFSGGMAQRVAIGLALAGEPEVLIADEATSALDVTTQAQVLDLLLNLREEMGMAIIAITHDLGVAAEICDRVAVVYHGDVVETAPVTEIFDHPGHEYTARLLASHPAAQDRNHTLEV